MASCVWLNHFSHTLSLHIWIKLLCTLLSNLSKPCCWLGRAQEKTEQFSLGTNRSQLLTRLNFHSKANFGTKMQIITVVIALQHPQVRWLLLKLNKKTRTPDFKSSQCSCLLQSSLKTSGNNFHRCMSLLMKGHKLHVHSDVWENLFKVKIKWPGKELGLCEWAGI